MVGKKIKIMNIEEYAKYKQFYDQEIPELVSEYLSKNSWKTYLDLGCGDGSLLNALNEEDYFNNKIVYAIDLSENRINLVKKINKNFICFVADACDVKGIEDNSIDFLVSTQLIEHVESDDRMVKEIKRVLKSNATAYVTTVFKKWYGWYFYKCNGKWTLDPTHLREYDKDEQLLGIFEKYGFEIIDNKKTLIKHPLINFILKRIGVDRKAYNNLFFNFLRKVRIPIFGYYKWEILCKKK